MEASMLKAALVACAVCAGASGTCILGKVE
jgi:hypothetical protein